MPVVDTVGCGDSFAAGVALGFTRGHSPEATLALANAVGAATAMGRGGHIPRFVPPADPSPPRPRHRFTFCWHDASLHSQRKISLNLPIQHP